MALATSVSHNVVYAAGGVSLVPAQPMPMAGGGGAMPNTMNEFCAASLADESGPAWSEGVQATDAIAVGIDLGTAWVRAAIWDATGMSGTHTAAHFQRTLPVYALRACMCP